MLAAVVKEHLKMGDLLQDGVHFVLRVHAPS